MRTALGFAMKPEQTIAEIEWRERVFAEPDTDRCAQATSRLQIEGYDEKISAARGLPIKQSRSDMPKKKTANLALQLTAGERDLLSQMQNGYQLETDSLGGSPVLRRLKDGEVIRPLSAKASSVKALQERGLIRAARGRDPLIIVWLSKRWTVF